MFSVTRKIVTVSCVKMGLDHPEFPEKDLFNTLIDICKTRRNEISCGHRIAISDLWYIYPIIRYRGTETSLSVSIFREKIYDNPLYKLAIDKNADAYAIFDKLIATHMSFWRDYLAWFTVADMYDFISSLKTALNIPDYPVWKECYLMSIFIMILDAVMIDLATGYYTIDHIADKYPILIC